MKRRIGVWLGSSSARAVGVEGGRVAWAVEGPDGKALGDLMPPRGWHVPVGVAVGGHGAVHKTIGGLQPGLDAATLHSLVAENTSSFFVGFDTGNVITSASCIHPHYLAWVIRADAVDDIIDSYPAGGRLVEAIGPASAFLPGAFLDPAFDWSADGFCYSVAATSGGHLVRQRRQENHSAAERSGQLAVPRPVPGLAPLGDRASEFAAAYGAAIFRPQWGWLDPTTLIAWNARASISRYIAPAACTAAAVAAIVLSPLGSTVRAVRAERELARIAKEDLTSVSQITGELARSNEALRFAQQFTSRRDRVTSSFGRLASILPDSTAVSSLLVDTSAAVAVVVTTDSAAVRRRVEQEYPTAVIAPLGWLEGPQGPRRLRLRLSVDGLPRRATQGDTP